MSHSPATTHRKRVYVARSRWTDERRDLRTAEYLSKQSVGHASSRTLTFAKLPREKLVQKGTGRAVDMALRWYKEIRRTVRRWLLRRLPPCEQIVAVISQSLERPLSLRERVLRRLHLWVCIWCVWYQEQLQIMRKTLRTAPKTSEINLPGPGLSNEARERIKRNLTNKTDYNL